jgi:cbb3-type cytochrome oxidase maturation protein
LKAIYTLLPIALILLGLGAGALIWAVRSGQFEDLEGPAHRIIHDDDDPRIPFNAPQGGNEEDKGGAGGEGEEGGPGKGD